MTANHVLTDESQQTRRRQLAGDPQRPIYHFLPPANWMNDPNGLIEWKGQVHLFYQYNPLGPWHERIHWGHAVSDDLVHWRDLPMALTPTPGGPDAEGCWSGCAVDHNGVPTLIYTGVSPQTVCLATSQDELLTWKKHPASPVISSAPPEIAAVNGGDFRDPFVWREEGAWWMLMGSRQAGAGGLSLLYRSHDLLHWEFVHTLLAGNLSQDAPFSSGAMWECPNLLDFGDRRSLIVSLQSEQRELLCAVYFTGPWRAGHFTVETQGVLVYGNSFYAPQVLRLRDGRSLLWGWLREERSKEASLAAGWNGVMSLPLQATLAEDGSLRLQPVAEVQTLRRKHHHFDQAKLATVGERHLQDVAGDALEIIAYFNANGATDFGLAVRSSPDGAEETQIIVRPDAGVVEIRREHASLSSDAARSLVSAPLPASTDQGVKLHLFLDRSVLELFVNDQICLACRIYPTRADSLGVRVLRQKDAGPTLLDVWSLAGVWPVE